MGPERNFLSLSGNLSKIFGTGTECFPKSKIRKGTGTERQFFGNFLSFPERFLSHFLDKTQGLFSHQTKLIRHLFYYITLHKNIRTIINFWTFFPPELLFNRNYYSALESSVIMNSILKNWNNSINSSPCGFIVQYAFIVQDH